jgi:hypothetical protein
LPDTDEISVFVVEDDAMVRDWLRLALEDSKTLLPRTFAKLCVRRRAEAVSEARRRRLL